MNILSLPSSAAGSEFHTDAPASAEEVAIAFDAMLAVADGDRTAAAVLAVGAVLADAIRQIDGRTTP